MKARILVALLAVLYLLLIPYTFVQAQLLRTGGLRQFDAQVQAEDQALKGIIQRIDQGVLSAEQINSIKQQNSRLLGPGVEPITNAADLRLFTVNLEKRKKNEWRYRRAQNDRAHYLSIFRLALYSLMYAAIFSYFWRYWPTAALEQSRQEALEEQLGINESEDLNP